MDPSLINDSRSLLLLSIAIYLTLAAFMLLMWQTRRVQPGFGVWALSDLILGVSLTLLVARQWLPTVPTAILGNAGLLATPVLTEWALRKALGRDDRAARKTMLQHWGGAYLIWLLTLIIDLPLQQRGAAISAGLIWLNLRIVALLLPACRSSLPLLVIAVIHALFTALHAARTVRYLQIDRLEFFTHDPWLNAGLLLAALLLIARDMGFLCFTHARIEAELLDAQDTLLRRANEDVLTGLGSRRYFEDMLPVMQAQARRQHLPQTLLLIDVDHFKAINDRFGHQAGDHALIALADALRQIGRNGDLYARLGGDEFVLLLHDCSAEAAEALSQRLTDAIATHVRKPDGTPVSVSIGYTPLMPYEKLQIAYPRADRALYAAKAAGRGCAVGVPLNSPAAPG
ncbi:GGDEF domain-containing protein [Jeongeupia wiesaeckerbachi]|uniref:GGDEF domain-containing protein n=1 Tax=Jeongeupia wiesaeckerbachi TaxID=3051218 RepID=UPI003D805037